MSTRRRQIWDLILLLLLLCEETCTKTLNSTPSTVAALQAEVRSVVLTGESGPEKIQVLSPVNLTLECRWAGNPNRAPTVSGFWRKDGVEVLNSRQAVVSDQQHFNLRREFNIEDEKDLGNYSCVFGEDVKLDFLVEGPQMEAVREKPVVGYVGDYVVMECKLDDSRPRPSSWTWFRMNDTEKEPIDASESSRYKVKTEDRKSRLQVHNLTKDDSGFYFCGAVYAIRVATSRVELKVITFYEPLKPFIAIIIEVLILVAVILLYERSQSGKKKTEAAAAAAAAIPLTTSTTSADQTKPATSAQSEVDDKNSSVRHRGNSDEAKAQV